MCNVAFAVREFTRFDCVIMATDRLQEWCEITSETVATKDLSQSHRSKPNFVFVVSLCQAIWGKPKMKKQKQPKQNGQSERTWAKYRKIIGFWFIVRPQLCEPKRWKTKKKKQWCGSRWRHGIVWGSIELADSFWRFCPSAVIHQSRITSDGTRFWMLWRDFNRNQIENRSFFTLTVVKPARRLVIAHRKWHTIIV